MREAHFLIDVDPRHAFLFFLLLVNRNELLFNLWVVFGIRKADVTGQTSHGRHVSGASEQELELFVDLIGHLIDWLTLFIAEADWELLCFKVFVFSSTRRESNLST